MSLGYKDTPILPDSGYHVHDGDRPQPPVVTPGAPGTSELITPPPSDAIVLFDGTDLRHWRALDGGEARWRVENGSLQVEPGTGDIRTVESFGDIQLHLEWAAPAEVHGEGQGRGNSGVFLMDRYEIQILDCFQNPTYADGTTGAVYGQYPPMVNACLPPGQWQTFDILWQAPRFDGEQVARPATVTVLHNGVLLHLHRTLLGATGYRCIPGYTPHGNGPIRLQDHGHPVRFRNIWVRRLDTYL
ncbi:MAG: DUF1080 domain-containing protein [Chloroherpetonaceae bacterium]|nr:DUF1080 domain-containing protein [Chthonomonadaceae bacterium]MDW8209344.1 DUF1080 domain-containing protein [Chloroherpetonaceae bacterium]